MVTPPTVTHTRRAMIYLTSGLAGLYLLGKGLTTVSQSSMINNALIAAGN